MQEECTLRCYLQYSSLPPCHYCKWPTRLSGRPCPPQMLLGGHRLQSTDGTLGSSELRLGGLVLRLAVVIGETLERTLENGDDVVASVHELLAVRSEVPERGSQSSGHVPSLLAITLRTNLILGQVVLLHQHRGMGVQPLEKRRPTNVVLRHGVEERLRLREVAVFLEMHDCVCSASARRFHRGACRALENGEGFFESLHLVSPSVVVEDKTCQIAFPLRYGLRLNWLSGRYSDLVQGFADFFPFLV